MGYLSNKENLECSVLKCNLGCDCEGSSFLSGRLWATWLFQLSASLSRVPKRTSGILKWGSQRLVQNAGTINADVFMQNKEITETAFTDSKLQTMTDRRCIERITKFYSTRRIKWNYIFSPRIGLSLSFSYDQVRGNTR